MADNLRMGLQRLPLPAECLAPLPKLPFLFFSVSSDPWAYHKVLTAASKSGLSFESNAVLELLALTLALCPTTEGLRPPTRAASPSSSLSRGA